MIPRLRHDRLSPAIPGHNVVMRELRGYVQSRFGDRFFKR
jgi:hypothetical protein